MPVVRHPNSARGESVTGLGWSVSTIVMLPTAAFRDLVRPFRDFVRPPAAVVS